MKRTGMELMEDILDKWDIDQFHPCFDGEMEVLDRMLRGKELV